jgi:hypothetical protein
MILNDSEVPGGDVLKDTAPFTFDVLNGAYERVQLELATVGVETYAGDCWFLNLPAMPTTDPEARLTIDDSGTHISYPNQNIGSNYLQPQLPSDLIVPLKLWERQANTQTFTGPPMKQNNDGLFPMVQQNCLVDWQWLSDSLVFRGALQSQDVKMRYEKQLPVIVTVNDPVPIRGVTNAAAYHGALIFAESRGGAISPMFEKKAQEEIFLLQSVSARRRQRKQVRRKPYSGQGGRRHDIY